MLGRRLVAVVLVLAVMAACAGPEDRVTGVVIEVDGTLEEVRSFTIVTGDGDRMTFRPGPGVDRFEHGAPLPHLTEHLRTGEPIRVTYEPGESHPVALIVEDASG
jgi:hypothetical protein